MVRRGVALELKDLFGTSLRQCRRARRLTQAQLAEATDLSLEMIGRIERGLTAPSFETLAALAGPARSVVRWGAERDHGRAARNHGRINKLLASTSDQELRRAE